MSIYRHRTGLIEDVPDAEDVRHAALKRLDVDTALTDRVDQRRQVVPLPLERPIRDGAGAECARVLWNLLLDGLE